VAVNVGIASTPYAVERCGVGGVALEVEQHEEQLHPADAVGHRVVDLHDHRGAVVGEALHERVLPERARAVEAGHRRGARQVEHRVVGGLAHPDATQVVHEVEVGVGRPVGRTHAQERGRDALAHAWDQPRPTFQPPDEVVPVRRPVEEQHRDDGRAQQRVLLDVPHERVGVAHVRIETLDVVRSGHGLAPCGEVPRC
jgi:hypothetical protein